MRLRGRVILSIVMNFPDFLNSPSKVAGSSQVPQLSAQIAGWFSSCSKFNSLNDLNVTRPCAFAPSEDCLTLYSFSLGLKHHRKKHGEMLWPLMSVEIWGIGLSGFISVSLLCPICNVMKVLCLRPKAFLKISPGCGSVMKATFPTSTDAGGIKYATQGLKSQALLLCFCSHPATLVVLMDAIRLTTDANT